MTKTEASIANRVLLFCFVVFIGAVIWLGAIGFLAEHTVVSGNLKLWLGLVFGSALVIDRVYVKVFPVDSNEKTRKNPT